MRPRQARPVPVAVLLAMFITSQLVFSAVAAANTRSVSPDQSVGGEDAGGNPI